MRKNNNIVVGVQRLGHVGNQCHLGDMATGIWECSSEGLLVHAG